MWLDNKKYIEQHNMNEAEERGFTLAMNQFADLVSPELQSCYEETSVLYNPGLKNIYHRYSYTTMLVFRTIIGVISVGGALI